MDLAAIGRVDARRDVDRRVVALAVVADPACRPPRTRGPGRARRARAVSRGKAGVTVGPRRPDHRRRRRQRGGCGSAVAFATGSAVGVLVAAHHEPEHDRADQDERSPRSRSWLARDDSYAAHIRGLSTMPRADSGAALRGPDHLDIARPHAVEGAVDRRAGAARRRRRGRATSPVSARAVDGRARGEPGRHALLPRGDDLREPHRDVAIDPALDVRAAASR